MGQRGRDRDAAGCGEGTPVTGAAGDVGGGTQLPGVQPGWGRAWEVSALTRGDWSLHVRLSPKPCW